MSKGHSEGKIRMTLVTGHCKVPIYLKYLGKIAIWHADKYIQTDKSTHMDLGFHPHSTGCLKGERERKGKGKDCGKSTAFY